MKTLFCTVPIFPQPSSSNCKIRLTVTFICKLWCFKSWNSNKNNAKMEQRMEVISFTIYMFSYSFLNSFLMLLMLELLHIEFLLWATRIRAPRLNRQISYKQVSFKLSKRVAKLFHGYNIRSIKRGCKIRSIIKTTRIICMKEIGIDRPSVLIGR